MAEGLARTRCGAMIVAGDTHIGKWIEETGRLDHDRWLLDRIEPFIPVGGHVVDVGALYGDHTIAYSRRVGPRGRVFAYEPNLIAYRCLKRNMKHFGCDNVMAFPTALGVSTHPAFLLIEQGNVGMCRVVEHNGTHTQATFIDTIDNQEFDRLDFLKIDAEGEELNILKGATDTLQRCKPRMLIEVNRSRLELRGTSAEALIDFILSSSYIGRPLQSDLNLKAEQFDFLAEPTYAR